MIKGLKKAIKIISKAKNLRSAGCAIALLDKELKEHEAAVYVVVADVSCSETPATLALSQNLQCASLKEVQQHIKDINDGGLAKTWKNCRIARLQFLDEEVS